MFPTNEQVEARIKYCTEHPEARPPSGDFCRACLGVGLSHCAEVEYCGQREPYPSAGEEA